VHLADVDGRATKRPKRHCIAKLANPIVRPYVHTIRLELNRMRRLASLFLLAAISALAAPHARAADPLVPIAAHRAVYKLALENARGGDVTSAHGSMSYEIIDACDGWAVHQRLQMLLTNRDGQDIDMSSDYTTWESKDGLKLRFRTRQVTDTSVTSEVAGEASLESGGGKGTATYTLPESATKDLPAGTLFPTAHTSVIIEAAIAGRKFLAVPLFDGTSANGAQDSTIAIAPWGTRSATAVPELIDMPSGRVRVAFFERDSTNQQSEYEVAMRYWANGVADNLSMDFGDFVMAGTLTTFTPMKPAC
jgi:hypothetical protein